MRSWIDNRPAIQYDIKILCVLPSLFNRGVVPRRGLPERVPSVIIKVIAINIFMSPYLSRIEGPPPKRNVAGSIPVGDATNNAESLDFSRFSAFFIYGFLSLLKRNISFLIF